MTDIFWDARHTMSHTRVNAPPGPGGDSMDVRRNERSVAELEDRIDKLSMICCAMWTILQAHTDVKDEELIRLVQELDLCDGELDGKARIEQVQPCRTCKRPVATRHIRCIYCGTERTPSNPFDDVL